MRNTTIKFKFKRLPNLKVVGNKEAIKGASKVTFDFTGIFSIDSKASKISIDWGDGSPILYKGKSVVFDYREQSIFDEVLYGALGGTVLTSYSHEYFNDTAYYGKDFFAKILITWEDGTYTYIVQPITVFWDSFYDDVQELSILSTQVLPISTNETFINLESKFDKATLIGAAKTTGIPLLSAARVSKITELDPLGFDDEGILAAASYDNILFPFDDGEKVLSIVMGYDIYDTCNTIIKYYTIVPDKTQIIEGEEVTFYITADGVPDNTKIYFETSRTDLTNSSGFVIIRDGRASFSTTAIRDGIIEGYSIFNAKLREGSPTGEIVAVSVNVGINDFIPTVLSCEALQLESGEDIGLQGYNYPGEEFDGAPIGDLELESCESLIQQLGIITFEGAQITNNNNLEIYPQ